MTTAATSRSAGQPSIEFRGPEIEHASDVLNPRALAVLAMLHERFESRRRELLARRQERQAALDAGELPDFLPKTVIVRESNWRVAPVPEDLLRGFLFADLGKRGAGAGESAGCRRGDHQFH